MNILKLVSSVIDKVYSKVPFAVIGSAIYIHMVYFDLHASYGSMEPGTFKAAIVLSSFNFAVLGVCLLSIWNKIKSPKVVEMFFFMMSAGALGLIPGIIQYYKGNLQDVVNPTVSVISIFGILLILIAVWKENS